MAQTVHTSVRLSREAVSQLKALKERWGLSTARVIEMAIRVLYLKETRRD